MAFLDKAAAGGLLPGDPTKLAVVRTLLENRRRKEDAVDVRAEEIRQSLLGLAVDDVSASPPASPGVAHLTMSAAWLCEMVDNFVMLEEIRTHDGADGAPSFEDRWGSIFRETGERLKAAMRAMTDQDWRSIDQFPDRAGRIRVLTDRLREELRVLPDRETAPTDEWPPEPALPDVLSDAAPVLPALARGDQVANGATDAMSMEDILRAAGYLVRTLPAMRGAATGEITDYLVQRDGFSVLVRLADLSGGGWTMDGDSLAPWRGAEASHPVPSPCRAVWQRLALLRSLSREAKPCAGVVVLRNGHFTDEQAVARIVERDRRRTDVDLAWLDRESSTLPDLTAWLVRMESSQSKVSGNG